MLLYLFITLVIGFGQCFGQCFGQGFGQGFGQRLVGCDTIKHAVPMELKYNNYFSRTVIDNNVKRYSRLTGVPPNDVIKCLQMFSKRYFPNSFDNAAHTGV